MWWIIFYILVGAWLMLNLCAPMDKDDYLVSIFVRAIMIALWPLFILVAIISVLKEVEKKEEELK